MFFLALLLSNLLMGSFSVVQGCDNPLSGASLYDGWHNKVREAARLYAGSQKSPTTRSHRLLPLVAQARSNDLRPIVTQDQAASEPHHESLFDAHEYTMQHADDDVLAKESLLIAHDLEDKHSRRVYEMSHRPLQLPQLPEQNRGPAPMAAMPVTSVTPSFGALTYSVPSTPESGQTDRELRELDALHAAASLERRRKELIQAISAQDVATCRKLLETTSPDFHFFWNKNFPNSPIYSDSEFKEFKRKPDYYARWSPLFFALKQTQNKEILLMLAANSKKPLNNDDQSISFSRFQSCVGELEKNRDIAKFLFNSIDARYLDRYLSPGGNPTLLKMAFDKEIGITDEHKELLFKKHFTHYLKTDTIKKLLENSNHQKNLEIFLLAGFLTSDSIEQKVSDLCPWYNELEKTSQSYRNVQFNIAFLRDALKNIESKIGKQFVTCRYYRCLANSVLPPELSEKIASFLSLNDMQGYNEWCASINARAKRK